jgi:sensor histidine kinase YesM
MYIMYNVIHTLSYSSMYALYVTLKATGVCSVFLAHTLSTTLELTRLGDVLLWLIHVHHLLHAARPLGLLVVLAGGA